MFSCARETHFSRISLISFLRAYRLTTVRPTTGVDWRKDVFSFLRKVENGLFCPSSCVSQPTRLQTDVRRWVTEILREIQLEPWKIRTRFIAPCAGGFFPQLFRVSGRAFSSSAVVHVGGRFCYLYSLTPPPTTTTRRGRKPVTSVYVSRI